MNDAAGGAAVPRILYADAALVVIDKPAGMPSVPARTAHDPPAAAAVLADRFGAVEAVHRLDRDTSGILVLARTREARRLLGVAFESRTVDKEYVAVVEGVPARAWGTLHAPLAPDPGRPPRQRVDPTAGRAATTRWRLLAVAADRRRALLALEPLTGRSHQLRVHLAWLGLPIVGDPLYGRPRSAGRMLLHAARLAVAHPADGRRVAWVAPACFPEAADGWEAFTAPAWTQAPNG